MKRFRFVRLTLALSFVTFYSAVATAETVRIASETLEWTLEKTTAEAGSTLESVSLLDRADGRAVLTEEQRPLFTLDIRPTDSDETRTLSSRSVWKTLDVERPAEGVTSFRFASPVELGDNSVEITLVVSAVGDEIRLAWSGKALSERWTLWRGKMPIFSFRKPENARVFLPNGPGQVRRDAFDESFSYRGGYPSGTTATMAWFALWSETTRRGLYFAALDPDANMKTFAWNAQGGESSGFSIDTTFENGGVGGNTFGENGAFVLRGFNGDWYDAARLYKKWVFENAAWRPELGEDGRPDIPQWMKENSVFLMISTDPRWLTSNRRFYTPLDQAENVLREFGEAVGLPGAVHWYLWHQNPYDNDYPHFFPAKEGFADEVLRVQENAHFRVMPYTNGRLWDTKDRGTEDWRFSSEGKAGALVKENGSIFTETYARPSSGRESDGSPCVHAAMCPASDVWARQIRENVLTAMNTCNTAGVYIDQVGAATPFACRSAEHGHPVGGGHWWLSEGYWKIFKQIRADMRREVPDFPLNPALAERVKKNPSLLTDRIITTECNAEVYAHVVDGFLTWHWQAPTQVPAFPVVYGGAVPMFGRCSTGDDLALSMRVSQALVWGEQIGWFDPEVRNGPAFEFVRDAILCRHAVREYFYRGEMLRAPRFLAPIPTVTADWLWGGKPNTHVEPAVQTSLWRIADFSAKQNGIDKTASALILFSNVSDEDVTAALAWPFDELGVDEENVVLRKIDAEGTREETLSLDVLRQPIVFPAKKSWAFELENKEP